VSSARRILEVGMSQNSREMRAEVLQVVKGEHWLLKMDLHGVSCVSGNSRMRIPSLSSCPFNDVGGEMPCGNTAPKKCPLRTRAGWIELS
jgi:hypothetical protein